MYTINTVLDPFVGQTWCFTLTVSLAFAKKHRSIKSVLRKMLQRSIKSVLEVTWEKRYNVAKSVLEVTHPNPPHPWHSITSMRKCQETLLPTPPHPTPSHHKLAPRQSASAKEPYYPPHPTSAHPIHHYVSEQVPRTLLPTTAHPTKNRAESKLTIFSHGQNHVHRGWDLDIPAWVQCVSLNCFAPLRRRCAVVRLCCAAALLFPCACAAAPLRCC